MKKLEDIEEILRKHKSDIQKRFKVKDIGVFGSYAKGKQKKSSDVDILVEFYEPIGWEFVDLKEHLEQVIGLKVDLVTPNALKQQMKDHILKEVVLL